MLDLSTEPFFDPPNTTNFLEISEVNVAVAPDMVMSLSAGGLENVTPPSVDVILVDPLSPSEIVMECPLAKTQ